MDIENIENGQKKQKKSRERIAGALLKPSVRPYEAWLFRKTGRLFTSGISINDDLPDPTNSFILWLRVIVICILCVLVVIVFTQLEIDMQQDIFSFSDVYKVFALTMMVLLGSLGLLLIFIRVV
mmetsp:Transcript_13374/g.26725  ORF Transcript_13374/g.26725 Transcript_13374/m.26725 type:complete len:124 (+) Transcript_13374:155-526(+)